MAKNLAQQLGSYIKSKEQKPISIPGNYSDNSPSQVMRPTLIPTKQINTRYNPPAIKSQPIGGFKQTMLKQTIPMKQPPTSLPMPLPKRIMPTLPKKFPLKYKQPMPSKNKRYAV